MTTIYKDTDHRIELNNLRDHDGDLVASANVNMTLLEHDGVTQVANTSWPIALTSDTLGDYYGTLPDDINVDVRKTYILEIVAEAGTTTRTWRSPVFVRNSEF